MSRRLTKLPLPPLLKDRNCVLLKAGEGIAQPDLWIETTPDGTRRVWKTWARRPSWERRTLGARLARREARALERLHGIEGIPRLLEQPEPWTFMMSWVDGAILPSMKSGERISRAYFDRLWERLSAMHALGMNHGDVRRKNLLVAAEDPDEPRLVDFTQCVLFRTPVRGWRRRMLGLMVRVDRHKFLELKERYCAEPLSAQEREELASAPWYIALGRFLRKRIYAPIKPLLGKK